MKNRSLFRRTLCCALLLAVTTSSSGFDTGHHRDMTTAALHKYGFSQDAIDVVVLQNWLVDWYAGHEEIAHDVRTNGNYICLAVIVTNCIPEVAFPNYDDNIVASETSFLHFDNLEGRKAKLDEVTSVSEYWSALAFATSSELHLRLHNVKEPEVLDVLSLLGVTLHAVQDFYSHSGWVDQVEYQGANGQYDVTTWWDASASSSSSARLARTVTGVFPDPRFSLDPFTHEKMNKDSYSDRQGHWERAYATAYWASVQWIDTFHQLVIKERGKDFWEQCIRDARVLQPARDRLTGDLEASRFVSEAFHKWKGEPPRKLDFNAIRTETFLAYRKQQGLFKDEFSRKYISTGLARDISRSSQQRGLVAGAFVPQFQTSQPDQDAISLVISDVTNLSGPVYSGDVLYATVHIEDGALKQDFLQDIIYDASPIPTHPPAIQIPALPGFGGRLIFFLPKTDSHIRVVVSLLSAKGLDHKQDQRVSIGATNSYDLSFIYDRSTKTCTLTDPGSLPKPCNSDIPLSTSGTSSHRARVKIYLESHVLKVTQ